MMHSYKHIVPTGLKDRSKCENYLYYFHLCEIVYFKKLFSTTRYSHYSNN